MHLIVLYLQVNDMDAQKFPLKAQVHTNIE